MHHTYPETDNALLAIDRNWRAQCKVNDDGLCGVVMIMTKSQSRLWKIEAVVVAHFCPEFVSLETIYALIYSGIRICN